MTKVNYFLHKKKLCFGRRRFKMNTQADEFITTDENNPKKTPSRV